MPSSLSVPSLRLSRDPGSVRLARGLVREQLEGWGLGSLVDDASLVVTELATNAVLHAGSSYDVSATYDGVVVRIEVRDTGRGDLSARPAHWDDAAPGGRGLLLVAALASAWGVRPEADGKTVWAELAA